MRKAIKILKALVNDEIIIKEMSLLKVIILTSIYVLTSHIISFIFVTVLDLFNKDLSFGFSLAAMTIATCMANICVVIVISNVFKNSKFTNNKKKHSIIRKKDILNVILLIVGFILVRQVVLYEIINKSRGPIVKENIEAIYNSLNSIQLSITVLILMIQMIVITPILEELFFRGIIFNGILNKYKGEYKKAIIYSSIIFAVAHLNIAQGINAIIAGILLCTIYYFTKAIKLSILAHSLNNLLILLPSPNTSFIKIAYILIGGYFLYKGIRLFKQRAIFEYEEC